MSKMPKWVEKYKEKGIAIEKRGDSYYASRVASEWDPEKKRAKKKTIEYLGVVTPEGILPPKHKRPVQIGSIMESGNVVFLQRFIKSISSPLAEYFPYDWQSILSAAVIKLCYRDPLSRMRLRYETTICKKLWPKATLNKDSLSQLLPRIGPQWAAQRDFFQRMAKDEKHMAIDLSHVFSDSQNIPWLEYGHNGDNIWRPQLGIILMWGTTTHRPGFLKLIPGASNSAQILANAVWESGLNNVVAVMDKGFWSPENVKYLEDAKIQYAMALRRNLPMVECVPSSQYKDHFIYRKHAQWWRRTEWEGRTVYHFLDKTLADQEESNYLMRIESGETSMKEYRELKNTFGTLSIITDSGLSAQKTYELYKERREVEYAFDALQNTLGADVTWMRSKESMQGYMFIFYVALHLYSQVLDHLKRKDLLKEYSVQDILTYLSKVCVVEVNGQLRLGEVTLQTKRVIDLLEVHITENMGL